MNCLKKYFLFPALAALILTACSKEISLEGTGLGGTAAGTLQDSLGNCKNMVVKGRYLVDTLLRDSNYILVEVNFTTQGKYKISTVEENGMIFLDSGFAFSLGKIAVKLKGKGKPILPGTTNFIVNFGNSNCNFSITTTTPENNGGSTASFLCVKAGGYIDYAVTPPFSGPNGIIDHFRATIVAGTTSFSYKNQLNDYTEYSTDLNDKVYTRKDNQGKYYQYGTPEFEYFYFYDSIVQDSRMDFLYLDESKAVNDSWETDTLRVGIDFDGPSGANPMIYGAAKLKLTILKKDEVASYFGALYNNIVRVKRELLFKRDNGNAYTILPYYAVISYAKGIGMVDQQIFESNTAAAPFQTITIKGWRGL